MKRVSFDLTDVDGVTHTYDVELFACDENVRLQVMLGQPLLSLVGRVIGAMSKSEGADMAALAEAGVPLMQMIEERGGPELVAKIFERTARLLSIPELQSAPVLREGAPTAIRQELKFPGVRDQVFGDGNFGEYWQAAGMVLLVNFTRLGRGGLPDWKMLAAKLTGGLWNPSAVSNAT